LLKNQIIEEFGCPEGKITYTHEAGDVLDTNQKKYTPLKGKKFIMYVGNAYPYKI